MEIRKSQSRLLGRVEGNQPKRHGKKWPGRHEANPGQV